MRIFKNENNIFRIRNKRKRSETRSKKIQTIAEFRIKNIKQFLRLTEYYRRLIPNFSKIA